MSLRVKLILTALVLILVTGGLGAAILYEEGQVENVVADEQLNINKIVSGFLALDVKTDQLRRGYTVDTAAQWQEDAKQIASELAGGQFNELDEQTTSAATKVNLQTIQTAMDQVGQSELSGSAVSLRLRETAFATIGAQTQKGLANSLKLQQVVGQNLVEQQISTKNIIIALCVTLMALVIGSFAYLFVSITLPIRSLTRVIEDISRGKLDASIGAGVLAKRDEIGLLARAFDRTIISLKLAMRDQTKAEGSQASENETKNS